MNPKNDQSTNRVLSDVRLWHTALRQDCDEAPNPLATHRKNAMPHGHDAGDEDPNAWS